MRLTFHTAGESHGQALVVIVEGAPAGLALAAADIDRELGRRMKGHGRGARMKIEQDRVEILAGVRAGETLGSPLALQIINKDWANWADVMSPEGTPGELRRRRVTRPRPGSRTGRLSRQILIPRTPGYGNKTRFSIQRNSG